MQKIFVVVSNFGSLERRTFQTLQKYIAKDVADERMEEIKRF